MVDTIDFRQGRDRIYRWLRRCLIGPEQSAVEATGLDLYDIPPLDRYHSAILFPIVKGEDGIDPATDIRVQGSGLAS